MSQMVYTALPMMNNLVNMPTTLNVSDYDSSATTSSMSSPNIYSASSPDAADPYFSPVLATINQDQLGFALPLSMGQPHLEVIEQPVDKFRFRYKSEMMGTHGSILAKNSDKSRKRVYPTVRLQNYCGEAMVRCSLYTAHPNEHMRTPHTHRLVVRVGNDDKDDPHELKVNAGNNYTAVFQGMGIIHTAKKHIAEELLKKKRALKLEQLRQNNVNTTTLSTRDETEIRAEAESEAKRMNLNSVTLCFEAFIEGDGGVIKPLCQPVFSSPINNMKSALTGELKICRIDKHSSSCLGGEEVFILVEKVGKKNIKIKFFELDEEDNEIWCDFGKFSELDVHHQYAIVFRTPPYRDTEISDSVTVYLQLYRPTDGDCSEPIQFSYKPSDKIGRKRQRISVNDSYNKHISQDNEIVQNLLNLDMSGNPSFSGIETTSTSLDALLRNPINNSDEFNEFMVRFSNSGNFQDYLDALPEGSLSLTSRQTVGRGPNSYIVTDSASSRTQPSIGKTSSESSKFCHSTYTNVVKECADECLLARQIVEEMKRNASMKKPVFTERVLKMFLQKSQGGNSALHAAIHNKQDFLLRHMLDVLAREPQYSLLNCVNDSQQTPLHIAAAQSHTAVKWLLNAGADPDRQDENGDTPLHVAVKHNANTCVEELLSQSNYKSEMRADLNKKNASGWTPLHVGVLHKNNDAIKSLVAAGANVSEGDTNGRTVLHFAADEDDYELGAYLLENTNIDVHKRDMIGYTAYDRASVAAKRNGVSKLCQILAPTVVGQMETEESCSIPLDLLGIKKEPEDSDDELHIDEDDDDEEEEDEDDDDDEEDTDKESNSTERKSPSQDDIENKHIMSLLQGVAKSPERRTKSPEMTEVKEEMFASPVSECTIPDENGLFNAETLSQLCDILDSSGSWADLAELLGYTFLIASIKDNPSPSRLLFNYADVDGNVTVKEIRHFLDALDEHKAVELVDLMLAGQES